MSFLQTSFLLGLVAIAIPVLLHFLSRWQVQRVDLGTMRFLREIVQDGARRRTIRRWFLLLTRMAVFALLAILFARPFLKHNEANDKGRLRLVLVDRSASMGMRGENGRLIDDAIIAAAKSAAEVGREAQVQWAWFDEEVEPFELQSQSPQAPSAMHGDTNYVSALSWCRDKIVANKTMKCDIVVVTDLQQSGKGSLDESILDFPKDVPVRLIDVGRAASNNFSISSAGIPIPRRVAGTDVSIKVALFNFAATGYEDLPLTATATDGKRSVRVKKTVSLGSGQGDDLYFEMGKLDQGDWEITVSADVEDDLAFDNTRFTAVSIAEPIHTLILDQRAEINPETSASFFLSAAIQSHEGRHLLKSQDKGISSSQFVPTIVSDLDQLAAVANPESNPLCIVANSSALDQRSVQLLSDYVNKGGKLLVFAGPSSDAAADAETAWKNSDLCPGEFKRVRRADATPFRIVTFDAKSQMLAPFADPQHGDLSRLSFQIIQTLVPSAQTHVLASFEQQIPAITEQVVGKGKVVWFMSAADSSWSSWNKSPLYLPLVQQMTCDLVGLAGEGPIRFREIGSEKLVERTPQRDTLKPVSYQPSNADRTETSWQAPGFHKLDDAMYVLNTATKESDTTRISIEEFAKSYNLSLAEDGNNLNNQTTVESHNELWYWFASALLVLVVVEYALSNRTSA